MSYPRYSQTPDLAFQPVSYPKDDGLFPRPSHGSDGNARTSWALSRGAAWADRARTAFASPPDGAFWAFDVGETEIFVGEWPDGDYECAAYVAVGLCYDPRIPEAAAFAQDVAARAPTSW